MVPHKGTNKKSRSKRRTQRGRDFEDQKPLSGMKTLNYRIQESSPIQIRTIVLFIVVMLGLSSGILYMIFPAKFYEAKIAVEQMSLPSRNDSAEQDSLNSLQGLNACESGDEPNDPLNISNMRDCLIANYRFKQAIGLTQAWENEKKDSISDKHFREYIDLVIAYSYSWNHKLALKISRDACPRRENTLSCLGRFLAEELFMADKSRGLPSVINWSGVWKVNTLNNDAKVVFFFSNGLKQRRIGRFVEADELMLSTIKALNRSVGWDGLKTLVVDSLAESKYLQRDLQGLVDVESIVDIWGKKAKSTTLSMSKVFHELLKREESDLLKRVKLSPIKYPGIFSQSRFLTYIFKEIIAKPHNFSMAQYERIVNFLERNFTPHQMEMVSLREWGIRFAIATGSDRLGYKLATLFVDNFPGIPNGRYLKGLMLLRSASSERQILQSTLDMRVSLRQTQDWEPLFALGIGYLKLGKIDRTNQMIALMAEYDNLNAHKKSLGRLWSEILTIERDLVLKRLQGLAIKIETLTNIHPSFPYLYQLKARVRNLSPGNKSSILSKNYHQSSQFRKYGDPLGALALLD